MTSAANPKFVEVFEEFYREYCTEEIGELAKDFPDDARSLYLDWEDLYQFDPDLADDYLSHPQQLRDHAEEALRVYELPVDVKLGGANVRIYNLPQRSALADIRSSEINTLIEVFATVSSVSPVESQLVEGAFECQRCGTLTRVPQIGSDASEPEECQGCERQGPFRLNVDQSEYVDAQTILLEEQLNGVGSDDDIESIVVELRDDLAGAVNPGATVAVTGILRVEDPGEHNAGSLSDKFIEAHSVQEVNEYDHLAIAEEDTKRILELADRDDILQRIADSIAPSVYGMDDVKQAIALQLFGGVEKHLADGAVERGDIHVLLVGDPATAKSRLIRRASRLAPRAVLASAHQTTKVGLTTAASPTSGGIDRHGDPWELQAGVLVLANHGLASIDDLPEFDASTLAALSDVLETQQLHVSKATITKTLPAKTSVLGAGNPKYGRFDPYEPVGEQLDLPPGLVSQFDLIFLVEDAPSDSDESMADHILETNRAGQVAANSDRSHVSDPDSSVPESPIDDLLLRKYIAYARTNCDPVMTDEAKQTLKTTFLEWRSKGEETDAPTPVSARELGTLIRLSEASARVRLADRITDADAHLAIDLVASSLEQLGIALDNTDDDTADVSTENGDSTAAREERKELVKSVIEELQQEHEDGPPLELIVERLEESGLSQEQSEAVVERLKQTGEVYETRTDHFRVV